MTANLIMPGNYGREETLNLFPCTPSENLVWDSNSNEMTIWVDSPGGHNEYETLLNQILNSNSKYKIMVLMEPLSLCPKNYEFVLQYEHLFDFIMSTYSNYGSHNPSKYGYYPGGSRTFIKPDDRKIYNKSKNISSIVSEKNKLIGHKLRHSIKDYHNENNMGLIDYLNPPIGSKIQGLKDYRFELVIENENYSAFSEKPLDSILCGCIPIYWVPDDTSYLDMFDKNGFVFFKDQEDFFMMLDSDYFTEELYISKLESIKNNFEVSKQYISFGDVIWNYGIKDFMENK